MQSSSEKNVIFDLTDVYFIASQGMRVLLNAKKQIAGLNGRMILAGLAGNIREVLSSIGFLHYFTILDADSDDLGYYEFRGSLTGDAGL